ncbi:MAG: hypothetical protein ABIH18_05330 [Candidatus Omnitrophota bacterium]
MFLLIMVSFGHLVIGVWNLILRLLRNTLNSSFCGSPRGEAEGLTAESIKILSSIIDPALSRRMTEIEFYNSLHYELLFIGFNHNL